MNNSYSFNIPNIINIFTPDNIDITNSYSLNQIHSNIVNIVDDNYINNSDGDALITNQKNIKLVIKTADCIPILLYDKQNKVLALVHSGWKGTINNIVSSTVNKMVSNYATNTSNIEAYIYPSIRKCHFEVEEDVYKLFENKITNIDKYTTHKGIKYYIDLQQIVKDNLADLGITNIKDSNICTYCCHDKFYSYRYNKTANRNILLAMIKEK